MTSETLDRRYLLESMIRLARVPTAVPLGYDTLMAPDHPSLVHYVQNVLRPELTAIGALRLIDVGNNLIVEVGNSEAPRPLLIQNYTVTQHHNHMDEPFSGKVAIPVGEQQPAVLGQGMSQNKVHQAVMLTVLKDLIEREVRLSGRLLWAINNEGRSTHSCSDAILDKLQVSPLLALLQFPTGLRISLGNRGRIDIMVEVLGKAAHSSTPDEGLSAIEGATQVLNRLSQVRWPLSRSPLGQRHLIAYKIVFEPLAPHTIPSLAHITLDCRLLPGDDPEDAVDKVREVVGDLFPFSIRIEPGVMMTPAEVDSREPGVRALKAAHVRETGSDPIEYFHAGTFDAGASGRRGIPTVMYGASGGIWPLGADFVTLDDAMTEALVLRRLILDTLTPPRPAH